MHGLALARIHVKAACESYAGGGGAGGGGGAPRAELPATGRMTGDCAAMESRRTSSVYASGDSGSVIVRGAAVAVDLAVAAAVVVVTPIDVGRWHHGFLRMLPLSASSTRPTWSQLLFVRGRTTALLPCSSITGCALVSYRWRLSMWHGLLLSLIITMAEGERVLHMVIVAHAACGRHAF